MSKYEDLYLDVYGVFDTPEWVAENIKTIPNNFPGDVNSNTYIRVTIIPADQGVNGQSVGGIINIDIFVPTGFGPKEIATIADKLDKYLAGKTKQTGTGSTQFFESYLNGGSVDKDNPSLYRVIYSIGFNHNVGV